MFDVPSTPGKYINETKKPFIRYAKNANLNALEHLNAKHSSYSESNERSVTISLEAVRTLIV